MKEDYEKLMRTRQYFVAAWRVIDSRRDDAVTIVKVSAILRQAIKANCYAEVSKTLKQFEKWIDSDTCADAHTYLQETTDIDLQPDVL